MPSFKAKATLVDVYTAKDVEAAGLTRGGLLLVALLSGGDYSVSNNRVMLGYPASRRISRPV
jgi:hypothetical protein